MKKKANTIITVLALAVSAWSCESKEDIYEEADYNKIRYVLADNYNLNVFGRIVRASGLEKELSADGEFTLLAPGNAAFVNAGYDTASIHQLSRETLVGLVNYHLLDGMYEFNRLPLGFNQELESRGGKLFVSRWAKGEDTTMTVNGKRIVPPINYKTNNGLIQILDVALAPIRHKTIVQALASDQELVLFSHIVQRSGLVDLLSGDEQFTLFAPDNDAVKAMGLTSLEEIEQADPTYLAGIVGYHLMKGRRYQQDFLLALPDPPAGANVMVSLYDESVHAVDESWGDKFEQTGYMYDGNRVTQSVRQGTIYGVVSRKVLQFNLVDAKGNDSYIKEADISAENGVIHIVTKVMQYK